MSDLAGAIGIRAEEQELVRELQSGSEQAFALLIAQYSQPIYSLIARSLRDPTEAADVTQEVFVKVFRSISGFHGDASLRTRPEPPEWWGDMLVFSSAAELRVMQASVGKDLEADLA